MSPRAASSSLHRLRRLAAHPEFKAGAREISGVAPGLAAWGLMTGVAMVQSGMSTVEALAMTLLVFAGSSQLAAIPLIAAGAPVWVILATSFCVNLRFVVFSAHLRSYVMHLPRPVRLLVGYVTADMTYVLFVRRYAHPPTTADERDAQLAYLAGGGGLNWASWQVASITGIVLAHSVPVHWGLGFAGILALTGVACSLGTSPLRRVSAGVAGAAAVAAFALPFKLNIVFAIAVAVALSLLLERPAPPDRRSTA
ncbi:AzlC family ABC transporter permease [Candidatus Skiveiella danica]|uniref:AzlC family ABC transporter permease n=1 Tax=Candidatus Skiveiella danica TaxID=3386177 RepID=UPI0009D0E51F|nr:MAG: AzlC protein [Alphaproteobacteria bacterium ADurb.Bin100]